MSYGGPISRSNVVRGGRSWSDHGDGVWRWGSGELCTALELTGVAKEAIAGVA